MLQPWRRSDLVLGGRSIPIDARIAKRRDINPEARSGASVAFCYGVKRTAPFRHRYPGTGQYPCHRERYSTGSLRHPGLPGLRTAPRRKNGPYRRLRNTAPAGEKWSLRSRSTSWAPVCRGCAGVWLGCR